ncbi:MULTISPECIES: hypothetical protein [unclassified Bradyrhizobium]|uniref:hypothetical protein n=2 Tax=Bradyrhizobium TaxID=374 RepID=UPI001FF8E708|nr:MULTISPECIES: hypothetical protein [unclassified Bradyrhizobium]MCK1310821.1 hypothetical protein [Bradyrhizobium sp. 45]MCK1510133.1 hypothetical protein [Bradyrhizobium sp. 18]MCK1609126.1 hypothetical protein [Bradyrhizobium sp. 163]MCK1762696.1 hypothetical protein [Bradyrhizobium sp. 136]
MKIGIGLIAAAVVCGISAGPAFAKTAKECTAEWRADKAGNQARGVTEKAYVEQCRGGAEPTAAAPPAKPVETAPPPAPRQAKATGSKAAKECTAEWRADKAGMQARGVTEKAYVEQCKAGAAPAASAPLPTPSAATPPPPAAPAPSAGTTSSRKTAKDCTAEWRADKAGMQARGVTEKAYVEQCKAGGTTPSAATPEPKPAPAAPAPSRPAPTATQAAPAPAPQKPAPTTAVPAPTPAQQTSAPKDQATLEAGQFADEASAKARCPTDTVVWVNLPSKVYHFAGTKSYGTTKRGAYMCEKEAIAAEDRASKTEKHP